MRLRQIALVARELEPVLEQLNQVFGLNIAYRDPAVATFGLVNAVMAVGGEFLEVVQPVTAEASAGRYLKRRGGDAGYMLIFQAPDALAHRARLEALGIRNIAQVDSARYTFTHFHPGDFNGVLTSIDTEGNGASWRERFGDWPPAGTAWRDFASPEDVHGIVGATVQARDPEAVAKRWGALFEAPRDETSLQFDGACLTFVTPVDEDGTGIVGIDIAVSDPEAVLLRADAHGITVKDGAVLICGTAFNPVVP